MLFKVSEHLDLPDDFSHHEIEISMRFNPFEVMKAKLMVLV